MESSRVELCLSCVLLTTLLMCTLGANAEAPYATPGDESSPGLPLETHDNAYLPSPRQAHSRSPAFLQTSGSSHLVQVNVDEFGANIVGDAANEPSLAVDPTNPQRIVIGWRQFDSIASNFRQAGWGYTSDGGANWTFPGVIQPGIFRSDPVMAVDGAGRFVYYSLQSDLTTDTFASLNGGASWGSEVYAYGGDKAWIDLDRTGGIGDGHLYAVWSAGLGCCGDNQFNRSTDAGASWEAPIAMTEEPAWGTVAVGPDGEVYVSGLGSTSSQLVVVKSTTLQDPNTSAAFTSSANVEFGGSLSVSTGPNPAGLLGQAWVAVDSSSGPRRGWVYLLASVNPPGPDPLDVHFSRSVDGGVTWSTPQRLNNDPPGTNAWQWFATMSVAANGRLDVIWNDSREDPSGYDSRIHYTWSTDGGTNWATSEPVTPAFDPHLGWPQQNKIGDYYDMVSMPKGPLAAISATFNGEQDVYFLAHSVGPIFNNGFESGDTAGWSATNP
ncbi:MAG: exo-alpha-sialidase [bacterium]|nr:exo-alpha-sialidase [bacterium]